MSKLFLLGFSVFLLCPNFGLAFSLENFPLYQPSPNILMTPDLVGMNYENITIDANGVRLNGWFIASAGANRTVLYLHGSDGNISNYIAIAKKAIFPLRANIFMIDYRGYGQSSGTPSEEDLYQDAQAAFNYLTQTRKISKEKIIIYGFSLGAAVAVDLATKVDAAGVIIHGGFTSVADTVQEHIPEALAKYSVHNKYDSLSKIGKIQEPALIIHGFYDDTCPFEHAVRLYYTAKNVFGFVKLQGGHADNFSKENFPLYERAMGDFINYCAPESENEKN